MDEVCEIVPSQKGNNKINVRGYLMIKERIRGDKYYWCCKKKRLESCRGHAITTFLDGLHYLNNFVDHHHSPQASKVKVAKTIAQIKQQACETRDKPAQIIQNNTVSMSQDDHPYMPTVNALRTVIKRVRKAERPPQPQNIGEVDVPNLLRLTLTGDPFLVKDFMIGANRILLFITKTNIQRLSQAPYWLMDGTFKTILTIFCQLYAIHAPVGSANSRILPLSSLCINDEYGNDEQFSLMLRHLFALAFLPSQEIPDAFDMLKLVMLPEANEVTQWFEDNYVHRKIRQHLRNGNTTRSAPLFPPELWSVYDLIETGVPQTQNIAEAWHRR
ncbi:hypothetical protein RclHR1_04210008 [Rhizophagus clarus]|uniref:FLYWCH-type domain-containing protein n=1 Tax=Rhizophagus clarus TaxID=94130 RepID=A0A2Z6RYH5_9GLOM|nr:hypothetical protein RclHR1_04210008 [Rhizophagus clarus]